MRCICGVLFCVIKTSDSCEDPRSYIEDLEDDLMEMCRRSGEKQAIIDEKTAENKELLKKLDDAKDRIRHLMSEAKKMFPECQGVRVKASGIFHIHTSATEVGVKIQGPDGEEEPCELRKVREGLLECVYFPLDEGKYVININITDDYKKPEGFMVEKRKPDESDGKAKNPPQKKSKFSQKNAPKEEEEDWEVAGPSGLCQSGASQASTVAEATDDSNPRREAD